MRKVGFSMGKRPLIIEFVLCLVLGSWGAHHFYKKHWIRAIVMLLLSCSGYGLFITIPWAMVDLLKIFLNLVNNNETLINEKTAVLEKYSGIINIEQRQSELENNLHKRQTEYNELCKIFDELKLSKSILSEEVDYLELGIYEPHFDFGDSEKFKEVIKENVNQQKELFKSKTAVKGTTLTGNKTPARIAKLMLKAFNAECDNLIENANWSNVNKTEEKIKKLFHDINKLGENEGIAIKTNLLKLKREQLFLCYEYEETKKAEKERQKEIQQKIREEQKAIKEAQLAQLKAEKEKSDFEKALKLAHEQLAKANEEERSKYEEEIAKLQVQLKEAEERQQKAISMAQQTKCGHVYIISNIGSFGENVYKIGLTRRLEPMERVDELGDASVPFKFDVHAFIYSDDAPALETELHNKFNDRRVNKVNLKKEFFNVTLKEIEEVVKSDEKFKNVEFINEIEAREYRESLAIARAKEKIEENV